MGSLHGSLWYKVLWCLRRTVWVNVKGSSRKLQSPRCSLWKHFSSYTGKSLKLKSSENKKKSQFACTGPLAPAVLCSHLTTAPVVTSASDKENPSGRSARAHYDHKRCKSGRVVQLQAAFKQSNCVVFGDRLRNSIITPVAAARVGARPRRPRLNEPVLPH